MSIIGAQPEMVPILFQDKRLSSLNFDDVIMTSRVTLFKVTLNCNFYGMIYIRPTKVK